MKMPKVGDILLCVRALPVSNFEKEATEARFCIFEYLNVGNSGIVQFGVKFLGPKIESLCDEGNANCYASDFETIEEFFDSFRKVSFKKWK